MSPLRFAPFIGMLIVWNALCLGDEKGGEASAVTSARSSIQPYVNWLPANSQTLVVSQRLYEVQIPAELDEDASLGTLPLDTLFLERHLTHMFEGEAREVLVDKRIHLWIEGSSRFYFPDFPDEVEHVQTVGVPTHYDGSHILVFDEATPPDTTELFEKLRLQHPEPTSLIPAAERHRIEGHETIAWSSSPPRNRPTGKETPEDSLLIAAALSIRYWIASPQENVLIVATSRDVLAETLRKVKDPDHKAFPASLEEWKHISGEMPTWGMRHLPEEPDPTDKTPLSNLRKKEEGYNVSGLAFEINAEADKAKLTFVNCSPKMLRWAPGIVLGSISSQACFTVGPHGSVLAHLEWSEESPEVARKTRTRLATWLLYYLGHAVMI